MIYLLHRLGFFLRNSFLTRPWCFSPENQVLIGSVPTLLPVLMLVELSAYFPLVFHRYLLDHKLCQEDNLNLQIWNTGDGYIMDYSAFVSVEAGHLESCKICHLRSYH